MLARMRRSGRTDYRWWLLAGDELVSSLWSLLRYIATQQGYQTRELMTAARLYGSSAFMGLSPDLYTSVDDGSYGELSMNLVRSYTNTAHSKIMTGHQPRSMYVTSGGDYELRERAKGLSKYTAGLAYREKQDDKTRQVAFLATLFGKAALKIYDDEDAVRMEAVARWEIIVEAADAFSGSPRCMYQGKWVDRGLLIERYPAFEDEIEGATAEGFSEAYGFAYDSRSDQVFVVEGWHLRSGKKAKDGRHIIAISNALLFSEEWEEDGFPFAFLSWSKQAVGFWPLGIGQELLGLQIEANVVLGQVQDAIHLATNPTYFVERGSQVNPAHLNNDIGNIVEYNGRPPILDVPRPVSPDLWTYLDRIDQRASKVVGLPQSAIQSMHSPGLTSGRAMLVEADQQSERFSDFQKGWFSFHQAIAELAIRCTRRLASRDPSINVVYYDKRKGLVEHIKWADVELDDDSYILQSFPVSLLPSTPEGRLSILEGWLKAGLIDRAEYKRLSDFPDLEESRNLDDACFDLLEKALERMLYGDGEPLSPEPFFDLDLCISLGTKHYLKAHNDNVSEERLALVRDFIVAAKAQKPPPPPPPGAGPPPPLPPDAAGAPPPMLPGGPLWAWKNQQTRPSHRPTWTRTHLASTPATPAPSSSNRRRTSPPRSPSRPSFPAPLACRPRCGRSAARSPRSASRLRPAERASPRSKRPSPSGTPTPRRRRRSWASTWSTWSRRASARRTRNRRPKSRPGASKSSKSRRKTAPTRPGSRKAAPAASRPSWRSSMRTIIRIARASNART